jgi:hypothetical protein
MKKQRLSSCSLDRSASRLTPRLKRAQRPSINKLVVRETEFQQQTGTKDSIQNLYALLSRDSRDIGRSLCLKPTLVMRKESFSSIDCLTCQRAGPTHRITNHSAR